MPYTLDYIFSIITLLIYKTSISKPIKVDTAIRLANFKPIIILFHLVGRIIYLYSLINPIDRVV